MSSSGVARRVSLAGVCLVLVLAGCEQGAAPGAIGTSGASVRQAAEADVEAPEIFNTREAGLWDGRPSLGGIWVAYPGIDQPERVVIRNIGNGQSVIGALFRRERENPGPKLQVSSDAAAALGLLAGQPSELEVVVIRRQTVAPPPPVEEAPAPEEAEEAVTEDSAGEAAAGAVAAAGAAAAGAAEAAEAAPEPKLSWWERMREKNRAAREAREAAQQAEQAAAAEPAEEISATPLEPLAAGGATSNEAEAEQKAEAATTETETDGADNAEPEAPRQTWWERMREKNRAAREAEAAAKAAEAEARAAAKAEAAAQAETAAPAAAAPVPAQVPVQELSRPFVQVGLFSSEENANKAAAQLRADGVLPTISRVGMNDKIFWRVLIGPMSTAAEREAILAKAKALGYRDAYFVRD